MTATISFKKKGGRMNNMSEKIDDFQAANALLQDVIINYRTVISFGQGSVDELTKNFDKLLTGPIEERKAKHKKTGFYFGIVLSSRSIYFAVVFAIALELIVNVLKQDRELVFFATYIIAFSVSGFGYQLANIPSIAEAK